MGRTGFALSVFQEPTDTFQRNKLKELVKGGYTEGKKIGLRVERRGYSDSGILSEQM